MRSWLSRWFGDRRSAVVRDNVPTVASRAPSRPISSVTAASDRHVRLFSEREVSFLRALIEPPTVQSAENLSYDDRAFVAGIQRRLRLRELELPVLPEMALRLSKMFRDGAPVSEFVKEINTDPSLVVEVLKVGNSAFYAAGRTLTSLQDAIVRIGLDRLQSVLMVAHLRGKVFKSGPFQSEADLLLELALPVGHLSTKVSTVNHQPVDVCYMRGALLHVEHLVILGGTAAIARDVKRAIVPSPSALHQAFARSGRQIREALAAAWNLKALLLGGEEEAGVALEYDRIRHALVCRWLRLPLPDQSWDDAFAGTLANIEPRVAPVQESSATEPPAKLAS